MCPTYIFLLLSVLFLLEWLTKTGLFYEQVGAFLVEKNILSMLITIEAYSDYLPHFLLLH